MMPHTRPTLLAIALVAAVPAVAVAQKPNKAPKPTTVPGPVSIGTSLNPSVFSTPVALTGRVDKAGAGVKVTLEGQILPSTTFATIATAQTVEGGKYRFSHRPPRNTHYRVKASMSPPVTSGHLLVRVRMLVGSRVSDSTPARGSRVRFSGIVRPSHDGRLAYVQRMSSTGGWVTVARTTLRALDSQTSRYSRSVRIRRSGSYRVRVLGHSDHAMGIGRTRTLNVH